MQINFASPEIYTLSDFAFQRFTGKRYVVFDIESTGPLHSEDSITQIGAVVVGEYNSDNDDSFMSLIKPWKPIPEKVEALTGVTNARVANALSFAMVWPEFKSFCSDAVLVTQCGYEFDFLIIDQECGRVNEPRFTSPRLDTKAIFAVLHPERSDIFSTNFLSDYYSIDRTAFKRHDALGDANLIARIFLAELEEAKQMGIDELRAENIRIKRFILPTL